MHQISDLERHDDRLVIGDFAEGFAIEMIEVRMRDEHEIDVRKIVQMQTRMPDALDHFEPLGPIRIDEHIVPCGLN